MNFYIYKDKGFYRCLTLDEVKKELRMLLEIRLKILDKMGPGQNLEILPLSVYNFSDEEMQRIINNDKDWIGGQVEKDSLIQTITLINAELERSDSTIH